MATSASLGGGLTLVTALNVVQMPVVSSFVVRPFVCLCVECFVCSALECYTIDDDDAVDLPNECSSHSRYNDCNGTPPGFRWTDTLSAATIDHVTVRFQPGYNCDGTTHTAALNGGTLVSYPAQLMCFCTFAGANAIEVTMPGSDYVVAGTNTFLATPLTGCRGFQRLWDNPGFFSLAHICVYGTRKFAAVVVVERWLMLSYCSGGQHGDVRA
jgi:hypothetical protein